MKKLFLLLSILFLLTSCTSFSTETSVTYTIFITANNKEEFQEKVQNTFFDDDNNPIYKKEFEGLENMIDFNLFNQIQRVSTTFHGTKTDKQTVNFEVIVPKYLDNLKVHHFSLDGYYKIHSFNQNKLLVSLYKYIENSEFIQFNRTYSTKLLLINLTDNSMKEVYDFSEQDIVISDAFENNDTYFIRTYDRLPTEDGDFSYHKSYDYFLEDDQLQLIHNSYYDTYNFNRSVRKNDTIYNIYRDIENNEELNYLASFNWNDREIKEFSETKTNQNLKLFDSFFPTLTKDDYEFAYIQDNNLILQNDNGQEQFESILNLKTYQCFENKQGNKILKRGGDSKSSLERRITPHHYVTIDDFIYFTTSEDFDDTIHVLDLVGVNSNPINLEHTHNDNSDNSFSENYLLTDNTSIVNVNSQNKKNLVIYQYELFK